MSKNLDKLKGHSDKKQDINRRKPSDVNGKESLRLSKRIDDLKRVITDPDVWNANIASRDRMDDIEGRIVELEGRVRGLSYLIRRLVMNKLIDKDQLRELEEEE